MRFVLATHHFAAPGGSETYLLTVAEQLLKLGHDVEIFSDHLGQMSDLARSRGITVCGTVEELSDTPSVILSQDAIVAYTLSDRWPAVPQIYVSHGPTHELQKPPAIPGIVSVVVAMSDRFAQRLEALEPRHRIVRLRQPIDVERLVCRKTPRKRPQTALLLGNYLDGEALRLLVETWGSAGISLIQVGNKTTNSLTPEDPINDADIVVGKARAILDAMACGRPAYVYDTFGTDGWVTPQTYAAMEADAFAGLAFPRVIDANELLRDLDRYDPIMGLANRELIMMNHHARVHTQQLVALARELVPAPAAETTPKRELARLVRSVWVAEGQASSLRQAFAPLEDRITRSEADNDRLRDELAKAKAEIDRLSDLVAFAYAQAVDARSELAAIKTRTESAQTAIADLTRQADALEPTRVVSGSAFGQRLGGQLDRATRIFRSTKGRT